MIDICVTHFGDKYSTKYIDNLEKGIARNYSGDFNFIVKTDCPNRHWDKMSFFDCQKRTIIMDIDIIVKSKLDKLFDYPIDGFGAFKRWWRDNRDINGGFYIIEPSENNYLLKEHFYQNPEQYINMYSKIVGTPWMGEQLFVNNNILDKTYLPNEWLGIWADGVTHNSTIVKQKDIEAVYRAQFNSNMLETCKLIHFIYDQKIEQHEGWLQDLWNGTYCV